MIIERMLFKNASKILSKTLSNKILDCTIQGNRFTFDYGKGRLQLKLSNYECEYHTFKLDIKEFFKLIDQFTSRKNKDEKICYLKIEENKLYLSLNALKFENYILINGDF